MNPDIIPDVDIYVGSKNPTPIDPATTALAILSILALLVAMTLLFYLAHWLKKKRHATFGVIFLLMAMAALGGAIVLTSITVKRILESQPAAESSLVSVSDDLKIGEQNLFQIF